MKRKNENVPGFDEIIFENRNKEYGAFDLRKHYNAATGISILGGIALGALVLIVFSFSGEKTTADPGPVTVVIRMTDPILADPVKPVSKPPAAITEALKNLVPEVTTDTVDILGDLPVNDDLYKTVTDRNVNDTSGYVPATDPVVPAEPEIFTHVEEMPEFPGGISELMKFINQNLEYPAEAITNNIQGRVIIKFAVNPDGSADRIQVLKGIDVTLDNEALRVIKALPKFKPGRQNGVPVPVWFIIPVTFRLEH